MGLKIIVMFMRLVEQFVLPQRALKKWKRAGFTFRYMTGLGAETFCSEASKFDVSVWL